MAELFIIAFLSFFAGYFIGRITHPSREEVESYSGEIYHNGFKDGYNSGYDEGRSKFPRRY